MSGPSRGPLRSALRCVVKAARRRPVDVCASTGPWLAAQRCPVVTRRRQAKAAQALADDVGNLLVPVRVPTGATFTRPACRLPLPTVATVAPTRPMSPSMRTASRSAVPWVALRAPQVVRDPPPGSCATPTPAPNTASPPGRDSVRRGDRPRSGLMRSQGAVSRPRGPLSPDSGSQPPVNGPSAHRSGRDSTAPDRHAQPISPPSNPAQSRPAALPGRPAKQPVSSLSAACSRPAQGPPARPTPAPRSVPATPRGSVASASHLPAAGDAQGPPAPGTRPPASSRRTRRGGTTSAAPVRLKISEKRTRWRGTPGRNPEDVTRQAP